MNGEVIILVLAVIAGVVAIIFFVNKKLSSLQSKDEGKEILLLQQQMGQLAQTLDQKLSETNRLTKEQLQESTQFMGGISRDSKDMLHKISEQSQGMVKEVTERLTKLDETNKQVIGFSEQLSSLEKVLKSQKQRGNLGEAGLKLVLENMLPPDAFKLQYQFDDGDTVDAAIFTKDGIISVDAKFSLENYNRIVEEVDENRKIQYEKEFKNDLKKRIDETSKYVKPEKGTLDFAFMFIPAEAIYYDLLVNEVGTIRTNTRSLVEYAFRDKKVIIVSPTTFAAYLKTVLYGLQALKIEEQTKLIQSNVEKLGKHLQAYEVYHAKVGGSLGTAVSHFNKSHKEFEKINKDVIKTTEGKAKIDVDNVAVEKPQLEE